MRNKIHGSCGFKVSKATGHRKSRTKDAMSDDEPDPAIREMNGLRSRVYGDEPRQIAGQPHPSSRLHQDLHELRAVYNKDRLETNNLLCQLKTQMNQHAEQLQAIQRANRVPAQEPMSPEAARQH
jgi:hypothetical protein